MSRADLNKQYVRDNVNPSDQEAFYDFFIHLEDYGQFQHWNLPRVMQVVSIFKLQKLTKNGKSIVYQQTKEDKSKLIDSPKKEVAASQLLQMIERREQIRVSPSQTKVNEKLYNSINLLSEIENIEAIKIKQALPGRENNNYFVNNEGWLRMGDKTMSGLSQPNKDIFQQFDAFIKQNSHRQGGPANKKDNQQRDSNEMVSKVQQNNQKFVQEKCVPIDQDTVSGKHEVIKLKDKLFKWKLSSKIKCQRNEAVTGCQSLAIVSHQMVHRIFLPDYAIYCIKTSPVNLLPKRTYEDFVQLRDILCKMFPGVKIPYLQDKSWLAESDITLINKNKMHLEYFLKGILEHPILNKSPVFKDFLQIESHKMMKKKYEQYEHLPKINSLSALSTQKGYAEAVLSQQQNRSMEELPKWQSLIDTYFQKCIDLMGNLVTQYEAIIQTFTQLSDLSSETFSQSRNLSLYRQSHQQFTQFFRNQDKYYDKCRKYMEGDVLTLKGKILPFLKYEKTNVNLFAPLIDKVRDLTEAYIKRMQNEPESPCSESQERNESNDVSFYDGLWEQSDSIVAFKYQVGYLNRQLLDESRHFSRRLMCKMNSVWKELTEKSNKQSTLSKKDGF